MSASESVAEEFNAVLQVLTHAEEPVDPVWISNQLRFQGWRMESISVRSYLQLMEQRGLTRKFGAEGFIITEAGIREAGTVLGGHRPASVIGKIDSMSYGVDFDIESKSGKVVVNTSLIGEHHRRKALSVLSQALSLQGGICDRIAIVPGGKTVDGWAVPRGRIGIATLCSVTVTGILIKRGIPVESMFSGLLEIRDREPRRFTDIIEYRSSTLDPLMVFIKSGLSSVLPAFRSGTGKVLANYREIPWVCREKALEILEDLKSAGLGGPAAVGARGEQVLGILPSLGRIGIVLLGGLNALAALEESGIPTQSEPISRLMDFSALKSVWDLEA